MKASREFRGCAHKVTLPARRFTLWPQPVRQNRVAARVTALAQFAQQHARVPHARLQALVYIRLERFQLARPCEPGSVYRSARRPQQVLPHRLSIKTSQLADGPNTQSFSLQSLDLFHVFPPEQVSALLWFPELGLHHPLFMAAFRPVLEIDNGPISPDPALVLTHPDRLRSPGSYRCTTRSGTWYGIQCMLAPMRLAKQNRELK